METIKQPDNKKCRISNLLKINKQNNLMQLFLIMIISFALMAFIEPELFLSADNLSSMAFQFPEVGVLAIAMMIAMLTGGIDLSIVGIANLSSILASLIMIKYAPEGSPAIKVIIVIFISILVAVITGVLCGLFNGIAISKIGIPPILTTLATMQVFTGIAIVLTKGTAIFGLPDAFTSIGSKVILGIPMPLIIFTVFVLIFGVILYKTTFGLKLYMMGTNPKASEFSGINNTKMLIKTYVISGLLAAFAGLIIVSKTNSAKADYGTSYTLQTILIAVLGGVNPNGGFGTISGVVMSILTLQFLSSGFSMMRFSNFFKDFIWGAVLILVMVINYYINKSRATKRS